MSTGQSVSANSESTSITKVVACLECNEENLVTRRFCGNCGGLLWEPCLACGESNSITERFCGECGIDCQASIEAHQKELTEVIEASDIFAQDGRYLDALKKLENVNLKEHSQLKELNTAIKKRIDEFPNKRQEAILHSQQVAVDAQVLVDENRFDLAHKQLSGVPRAFRSNEISELLKIVEQRLDETKQLRAEVKQLLSKKDYKTLLPKVQRLVELNSADQQMVKLRQQLEQRVAQQQQQESTQLLKLAKAALAKCDYKQLPAIIQKFPLGADSDPNVAKSLSALKERLWLVDQIGNEPFATPILKAIADRLLKLQPHDQQHKNLHQQLTVRLEKAKRELNHDFAAWAKPADSRQGLQITHLPLPKELAKAKWPDNLHPQAMIVPFGLALQGLGRADVTLNLAPVEKKSWLSRVSRRGGAKGQNSSAWGIEIGSKHLKALQLVVDEQSNEIKVADSVLRVHGYRDEDVRHNPHARTKIAADFLEKHSLEGQTVVLNLPGTQTLGRFFDIPAPKPDKFFEAVRFEVEARIPREADRLYFDYHWTQLPDDEGSHVPMRRVMLVAADRILVDAQLAAFEGCQAKQLLVQSNSVASGNAVQHSLESANTGEAVAVLEIGAATSDFVVLDDSTYWFRGLYQGTDSFDKAVANGLQKTTQDAENLRRHPYKVAAMHELHEFLQPEFASLAEEIHRSLQRFEKEMGSKISQLYLCGAGSQQFGLLRYLQSF